MATPSLPKPGKKRKIEIPLYSWPHYVPRSGPPPPPISLVPVRDSTGYIVSKLALPSMLDLDRNGRRLLYYVIGWTDLPAAKVTIPCTEILDYVSPRVVEEWEYQDALRREEEERQQRAEAAKLLAEKPRKRVGRPPKARPMEIPMEMAPAAPVPSLSIPLSTSQASSSSTSPTSSTSPPLEKEGEGGSPLPAFGGGPSLYGPMSMI